MGVTKHERKKERKRREREREIRERGCGGREWKRDVQKNVKTTRGTRVSEKKKKRVEGTYSALLLNSPTGLATMPGRKKGRTGVKWAQHCVARHRSAHTETGQDEARSEKEYQACMGACAVQHGIGTCEQKKERSKFSLIFFSEKREEREREGEKRAFRTNYFFGS